MIYYSVHEFDRDVRVLRDRIKPAICKYEAIYAIPQGGIPLGIALSRELSLPIIDALDGLDPSKVLIVDDLVDSGATILPYLAAGYDVAVLHVKRVTPLEAMPTYFVSAMSDWIVYWWEGSGEKSIRDSIVRILQYIGEDVTREGLLATPDRVVRSWKEIYGGYAIDPASVFTVFEPDGYNELVLLKNIEFYSTCEHHMLPFSGVAHIGYIADRKIVGVSKLARLLEIYARRLQIQERIGQQVTKDLMRFLAPAGAACIIEAQHLCMRCRGVGKQGSVMVTSSLTGRFLEDTDAGRAARAELMSLIRA